MNGLHTIRCPFGFDRLRANGRFFLQAILFRKMSSSSKTELSADPSNPTDPTDLLAFSFFRLPPVRSLLKEKQINIEKMLRLGGGVIVLLHT